MAAFKVSKYLNLVALVVCLTGCGGSKLKDFFLPEQNCAGSQYADARYEHFPYTSYKVRPRVETELGIGVDTSGRHVDLDKVDRIAQRVGDCLADHGFIKRVNYCAINVKIAPDAHYSEKNDQFFFPCKMIGTEAYDNQCTGVVQYPNTLVVGDDLAALDHELIHLVLMTPDHSHQAFFVCDK